MNALVHHDPALARWDDVPRSAQLIGPTDAVIRVDTTTACRTDLHLLKSEAPIVTDGRSSGCEAVGTVVQVGSAVRTMRVGDRLLVSCSSARGHHRSLLHRCRLVAEAGGHSSHTTSSTPGWTRPPLALASSTGVRGAGS